MRNRSLSSRSDRSTIGDACAETRAATLLDFPMVRREPDDAGEVPMASSFEAVYRREYPGLMAVAVAMTGDRDGAPDLVHDAMVRALMRWDRVSRLERPGAWMHHVLVNICRSRLRRRATELRYLTRLRPFDPAGGEPSTDTLVFWGIVRTLPARPRAAVALYFGADLTSVQIAEVLGVPEGTVRSDLLIARRLVMRELRGEGASDG